MSTRKLVINARRVHIGLFYFGTEYRPVPLTQQFIGVKEKNAMKQKAVMDDIAFDKAVESVKEGHQVCFISV